MRHVRFSIALFLGVLLPLQPNVVFSAMTSGNYKIEWDTVSSGGSDTGGSASFGIQDTLGGVAVGSGSSASYQTSSGYRVPFSEYALSLSVKAQGGSSGTAYTSFDLAGKHVTVSSASGFSVNQLIAVVEDFGFSQKTAIGFVTAINGTVITVDRWSGDDATMSASPSGGNDYAYPIASSSLGFGTLSTSSPNVQLIILTSKSTLSSGYSVTLTTDGNLRSGSNAIPNVGDGAVTLGQNEYGMSVTGDDTSIVGDVSVSARTIQSLGTPTTPPSRAAVVLKTAISDTAVAGSYGQQLYFTMTGTY